MPCTYTFSVDFLPPGVNHMYGNRKGGGKFITETAADLREQISGAARMAGFRSSITQKYIVRITLIMPDWDSLDVDSGLKATLDSVFGSRADHRIIRLEVDKIVAPKTDPQMIVEITDIGGKQERKRPTPAEELAELLMSGSGGRSRMVKATLHKKP